MSTCTYPDCRSQHGEEDGADFHTWQAKAGGISLDLSVENGTRRASWIPDFDYFEVTAPTVGADLAELEKLISDLQAAVAVIRAHFGRVGP
jgi:hypothetical protein